MLAEPFVHDDTNAPPRGAVSLTSRVAYSAPSFTTTSITRLVGIMMGFYLAVGADVSFLAFFISVARSFDIITDPLMGYATDNMVHEKGERHKSSNIFVKFVGPWLPSGRRRPFMSCFSVFYAVCLLGLYNPPKDLTDGREISTWFGFFYTLIFLFDTLANIPWAALGPELSPSSAERNKVFFVAGLFKSCGLLAAAVLPAFLTIYFTEDDDAPPMEQPHNITCPRPIIEWLPPCDDGNTTGTGLYLTEVSDSAEVAARRLSMTVMSLFFATFYLGAMAGAVVNLRENPVVDARPRPPFLSAVMSTLRNRPFMELLPAWVLDMATTSMATAMIPFFTEYVVRPGASDACDPECCSQCMAESICSTSFWLAVALLSMMVGSVVSMPVWYKLSKMVGRRRCWLGYNLLSIITHSLFSFCRQGEPEAASFIAFINGLAYGGEFLTASITADVIDYDYLRTGLHSAGRFTIFQIFLPKVVSVPSSVLPLALLSTAGFIHPCRDGTPYHPQPESLRWYIGLVFVGVPTVLSSVSLWIKHRFKITEEVSRKVQAAKECIDRGESFYDPVTNTVKTLPGYLSDEKILSAAVWRLDMFYLNQLEMMSSDARRGVSTGRARIATNLKTKTTFFAAFTMFFTVVIIFSIPLQLLYSDTTSWIPTLSVVLGVMCTVAAAANHFRYLAAVDFLNEDRSETWDHVSDIIEDVLADRKGAALSSANPLAWR